MDRKVRKYERAKYIASFVIWTTFAVFAAILILAALFSVSLFDSKTLGIGSYVQGPTVISVVLLLAFAAFSAFLSNLLIHVACDHIIELHLIRTNMAPGNQQIDLGDDDRSEADEKQEPSFGVIILVSLLVAIVILAIVLFIILRMQ